MHEFSIAKSILKIVEDTVEKNNAKKINELELEIGHLAGVEYDSLEFALETITKNSILSNAKILIIKPEGRAFCENCQKRFMLSSLFECCPDCKKYNYHVIEGKELRVKSILVD